jgi:hypothetical protein
MTRRAVIRLGPKPTAETLHGDARRDGPTESGMRTLYDSMRLAPDAPLLVDHDPERVVGRVVELVRWDDAHPLAPWLAARVLLDDGAAEWVRQGTPASLSYATMYRSEWQGWEICRSGYVTEVSVLSATRKPAEALAQVVLLREAEPAAGGEVIAHRRGDVIRRPCGVVLGVR